MVLVTTNSDSRRGRKKRVAEVQTITPRGLIKGTKGGRDLQECRLKTNTC